MAKHVARTAVVTTEPPGEPSEPPRSMTAPGPAMPRRFRWSGLLRRRSLPYLLILPALLFELLVHIVPMVTGVVVSFFRLDEYHFRNWAEAPFVGLRNFRIVLDTHNPIGGELLHSLLVTIAFAVLVIAMSWVLGMAGALAINAEFRGRAPIQALLLVPFALPVYVAVIDWRFMLQRDGAVNALLSDLHLTDHQPYWLIGGDAFWSMVMAAVWRTWPFAFLLLLAGLQTIPRELYEAASVDGASTSRKFRSITLPQLRPVNSVLLLILFLWTFNDFNVPFTLFGQAPPSSADVLALHIYVNSFVNFDFGFGAAMSVLLLLFLIVVSLVYMRAMRMGGEKNA